MSFPNLFEQGESIKIVDRINNLKADSQPQWGTMRVGQMLAHCCVPYEYVFKPEKFNRPGSFKKFFLKVFLKKATVGLKPFKRNSPTAPDFIMKKEKEFKTEKDRLINFIHQVQKQGEKHYDGKESHSFGILDKDEWNVMFYKHIDHHLNQFGV